MYARVKFPKRRSSVSADDDTGKLAPKQLLTYAYKQFPPARRRRRVEYGSLSAFEGVKVRGEVEEKRDPEVVASAYLGR